MAQNQVYLIKSGENSFVEETQAIVGISGGKVGVGTTHPEADLHVTGNAQVDGNLTVKGNLTTIDETTIQVDDKNIELGVGSATDAAADGGGITLHGTTNKTFNWVDSTDAWTSSEHLYLAGGKHFSADQLRALGGDGLSLFDTNLSGITIKDGKVGVHKTTPAYDLDVDGSGNFASLYVGGNSVLTGEGSIFGKWEDGATAGEIFYTGGNVGVGTTNPEHKFHVVGNGVVDGNFVVNGTSGTFNVGEFDVSGSNITLNSAGGGLDSSRGGLIVNAGGNKTFQYVDGSDFWQSSEDIQIVADKHLQTDKVRAIDAGGLSLQDDGGNGIHIQDGGQVNIAGLTKADGGLNVGNGKFDIQSDGTLGSVNPNPDDVIKWNGTKWVADVSPGGGGGGTSEVPNATINSLIAGESIQEITYGPYDSTPRIATDLEIVGDGSVIPYALSGVSETGYFAVFSQEIPNNNYKIHTVFGGKDVYWETGSSSSIYYNDGDVSLQRNLTVGGNLTVAGSTTTLNTQTLEIEDHNIVIASNTGHNQLTNVYPVGGDYAGVFWGTGDAGAASPVSLTYQSNKGFAFEGGNVGIGTTNPSAKLQIVGNSNLTSTLTITNNNVDRTVVLSANADSPACPYVGSKSNSNFAIYTNNTSRMLIDTDGNVGIGTTNPGAKLHIGEKAIGSYDYLAIFDSTNSAKLRIGDMSSASQNRAFITNNYSRTASGYTADDSEYGVTHIGFIDGDITFATAASGNDLPTNRMAINSAGRVGIGTTDPDSLLHLKSTAPALYITDTTNKTDAVISSNNGGDLILNADLLDVSNASNPSKIQFKVDGDERMRIDSDGNVGIGTTNPNTSLEVTGPWGSQFRISRDAASSQYSEISGGGSTMQFKSVTDDDTHSFFTFVSDNGIDELERMRIDSAGNVGIGTTSPSTALDINKEVGGSSPIITLSRGGVSKSRFGIANATHSILLGAFTDDLCVRTEGGNIRFGTASHTKTDVSILSNGNVGIGTTSPGATLQVDAIETFDESDPPVLTSVSGGIVVPRVTTAQRDLIRMTGGQSSPTNGEVIYNIDNNRFEFYQNNQWVYYAANAA